MKMPFSEQKASRLVLPGTSALREGGAGGRNAACKRTEECPMRRLFRPFVASSARQSISKVRVVSLSTVMRTFIVCSGSSGSIFSGHSTRQRSPE